MGFRFRKSFKIAPGVKLNLSKKSAGVSVGGKGFRKSFSTSGRSTTSVGIPGTGLSYVSTSDSSSKSKKSSNKGSASNMNSSKKSGCWIIAIPILIVLFILGGIKSCVDGDSETTTTTSVSSSTSIESFDFLNPEDLELEVGESERSYFTVDFNSEELSPDDIVFVSSDENVVKFTFDSQALTSFVYYKIEAVGEGAAAVHVESADGSVKSDIINVTVSAAETTTERTTESTTEATETTAKSTTEKSAVAAVATEKNNIVYVLNTSRKKIHYKSCSSVKDIAEQNYDETDDYDSAIAEGYSPCGRCKP